MQAIYLIRPFLYLAHCLNNVLSLNSISLTRFKNYLQQDFRFDSRIVGISGRNGVGKTNLLDAIYYLCFTKSYFGRADTLNAHTGQAGFRIEGRFSRNGQNIEAVCILRETGRKEFLVNGEPCERFATHVGKLPCVIIAPDDIRMITDGSEERRRYIDAIISQAEPEYLRRLISYNKVLQQRNSFLKSTAEQRDADMSLLDVYDMQLSTDGVFIFEKRKEYMHHCGTMVTSIYHTISGAKEHAYVEYESQLRSCPMDELLRQFRQRDRLLQRTSAGIHKDDLVFTLNDQPFRTIASQGQRKSLLFALRLAEFNILEKKKQFTPLLLLDDVFEKLDEERMHNLLEQVCLRSEGQIFITDTHAQRITDHFSRLGTGFQLISL